MVDKIIKLPDGIDYYVLDEFSMNKKIYLFGVQVDNKNDIMTDKCIVCEAKFENSKIYIKNIDSKIEQENINNIFIERLNKA